MTRTGLGWQTAAVDPPGADGDLAIMLLPALDGSDAALILLVALALDAAVGDPPWLYRAVGHPVAWIGAAVEAIERRANDLALLRGNRIVRGLAATVALPVAAFVLGRGIELLLAALTGGWLLEAALASALIAGRGLFDHVAAVARGLERGLGDGRAAVARIVGRDPESLDEAGVARAAAESAAENFSDGVVAPAFWFLLLGLGGLFAYKTINTLDSMIGHRDARFEAFGKAAARLDDLVNWLPARLAGLLIVAGACFRPDADPGRAWATMRRDAPKHRSPNAGWQEAALAGALGFALAGPRRYGGTVVDDAWMGDGRRDLAPADLDRTLRLYVAANAVLAGAVIVVAVL